MVRIAHIADVHYRGLSRHDEYTTVFQAFADDCIARKVDHIFVAGDIFHTKTTGLSPEYIEQLTWWLNTLAAAAHLHMMLGNHDGNLVNLSRQDAISPIVKTLNNPRVHLYKESGVYRFDQGFNWCVYSLFDEHAWDQVRPVPGDVNIACYHGSVVGARTETDWELEGGISLDFFRGYDFVMLGDIHRFQYLDLRSIDLTIDESDLDRYPGAEVIETIG